MRGHQWDDDSLQCANSSLHCDNSSLKCDDSTLKCDSSALVRYETMMSWSWCREGEDDMQTVTIMMINEMTEKEDTAVDDDDMRR